ncbi:MAG TPA: imidazole glycerol phosphate synthase subunit HisF [bacterium]|nr:imidazole glycerol phosphate synthase subunit HisF [bacterium]HOL46609.1 imidazole glycerol phosphate synthase subunit HisF [bacterium]HPQ17820.1 imidazole glycerol phosphate synthase subunit HisF [bacterium]
MLAKRIIPCLDVKEGRVVKGVNFVNLKDAGDPIECAIAYDKQNADELVFLDITASYEKRNIMIDIVKNVAESIYIPFTVGGGIRNIYDIDNLLNAGCDKVSINTAAVENPELINEAAKKFGSQCIVVAIDAKLQNRKYIQNADDDIEFIKQNYEWEVMINGGRTETGKNAINWAKECEDRGAGEILLTSMDADGTTDGYDISLNKIISAIVKIPVIASGGAGKLEDFLEVFKKTNVSAALAASVFHYNILSIQQVKEYLINNNIPIRQK